MRLPVLRSSADDELAHAVRARVAYVSTAGRPEAAGQRETAGQPVMPPRLGQPLLRDTDRPWGGWVPRIPDSARECSWEADPESDDDGRDVDAAAAGSDGRRDDGPLSGGSATSGAMVESSGALADRMPLSVRNVWERLTQSRVELGRGQLVVVLVVLAVGLGIAAMVFTLGRPKTEPVETEVLSTGTVE
ncbi:hypothetical protein, partial [Phytoactinopolyspora endophytica]|uniref:hypothetical protein n=1 Tax=Phytoactinopolyspora endophytica TaxID=1642495 RepID=UPI0013EC7785